MPNPPRRHFPVTAVVLLATLFAAACGAWLGRILEIRVARTGLATYGDQLVRMSDDYGAELTHIARSFNPSPDPFCSLPEIRRMQTLAFRSKQVKDIGRTRDGKLYCTSSTGVLPQPSAMPRLTMLSTRGMRIYQDAPLIVSPDDRGIVLEYAGVDAVLSPEAYAYWERPHLHYTVLVTNRQTGHAVEIAGDRLGLGETQIRSLILGQADWSVNQRMYRSRCSRFDAVCVVTSESTADVWMDSESLVLGSCAAGALIGLSLSLLFSQLYLQRRGLSQQLRRAIAKDTLGLVYQPVVDLASRRWVGVEALARWTDEDGVEVKPDFFVRIAEERGFIQELTALVVRRATSEMESILRENPGFTLSINVAASDLEGESLFSLLEDHVRRAGIRSEQIALELTERSTGNLAVVRDSILRLHRHGFRVHIDDFGTGFSSLSYLHELAVDAIKIDRSFTQTIGTDAVTASILPQIVALAESLHLEAIVEGVETETQVAFLESTGSPLLAQGWYFSKPIPAAELIQILHRQPEFALAGSSRS